MRIPIIIAFVLGLAVALEVANASLVGAEIAWTIACLGVGMIAAIGWVTRDDRVRRPLVPVGPALLTAACSVASAAGIAAGASTALHRGAALAAAVGSGFCVAHLGLFAGVQKTTRLHVVSAFWTGVAAVVLVGFGEHVGGNAPGWGASLGTASVAGAGAAVVFGLSSMVPAVRAIDMAAPIPERWSAGPMTMIGAALYGGGFYLIAPSMIAATKLPWSVGCGLAFSVAAWAGPWRAPRARRAGVQVGAATALFAMILALSVLITGGSEVRIEPVALVIGSAFLGLALPFAVRLYGAVPLGSNVLSEIPRADQRAPVGATVRIAIACFGAAIAATGWPGRSTGHGLWLIVAAGALLVLFDPRAGAGRKWITVLYAVLPAVATVAWAVGRP